MLSNEQRAHDLAITTAKLLAEEQFELALRSNKDKAQIDVDLYSTYVKAYKAALNALNKDFN